MHEPRARRRARQLHGTIRRITSYNVCYTKLLRTAISIKTARTGYTFSQRIYFQCESLGIENYMGNQIDGQVGTLSSLVFGAAYKGTSDKAGEFSNFLDMSDDLLAEPLKIADGFLKVRDVPGTGVAIDPDKLARYRTDA